MTTELALWLCQSGVKWVECESHHSPPLSVKIKNLWSFTPHSPIHPHGVVLKHMDSILFESSSFCFLYHVIHTK